MPADPTIARFIALEGGEGSGKSTQTARLAARLGAVATREPGGTAVGASLRAILLDPAAGPLDDRAEALMLAADRAQHVAEIVRPALRAGHHVVTDRYAGSMLAYQGHGRGLPLDELRRISEWASGGLWPDLTVLLDITPDVGAARLAATRADRLEAAGVAFHRRVTDGFRSLAATEPHPWAVVDATGNVDAVAAAVWSAVVEHCPEVGGRDAGQERA